MLVSSSLSGASRQLYLHDINRIKCGAPLTSILTVYTVDSLLAVECHKWDVISDLIHSVSKPQKNQSWDLVGRVVNVMSK